MIVVDNLVFEYPTKRTLHDIVLEISRGSITALVGPNGAGKTTLIRCLVALATPFSGRVLFNGIDVHKHPREVHRHMGYLPDFYGLYEELTVRQCLTYIAAVQGSDPLKRETLVESVARKLSISDRLNEKAGTLSRGLKQRLAIAQAIIHEPDFLVLDEPASGLDPDARFQLSKLLQQLRDSGMTLLVSSHILAELEDYSTHMVVIRDGRIVDQRAIAGAADVNQSRRIVVALTKPNDQLENLLVNAPGVNGVYVDGRIARCRLDGDDVAKQILLKTLIGAGLPIAEFREEAERMQETYMATMKKDSGS
ncbi:MAG: ABC transporter ATP-binding protein [Rhodospirillales bacterium]|jgi:ABC-2 type transport system ATP-binding protein